jgi:hypothetical protein
MFSSPVILTRTLEVHKINLAQIREHACWIRPRASKIELTTEIDPMIPVYKKIKGAVIKSDRA